MKQYAWSWWCFLLLKCSTVYHRVFSLCLALPHTIPIYAQHNYKNTKLSNWRDRLKRNRNNRMCKSIKQLKKIKKSNSVVVCTRFNWIWFNYMDNLSRIERIPNCESIHKFSIRIRFFVVVRLVLFFGFSFIITIVDSFNSVVQIQNEIGKAKKK